MLRVLQVIGKMDRAGAETIIMNIYRNIDHSKVQFDFMVFSAEKGDYDDEILQLGGNIYHMPAFKGYNYFRLCEEFRKFFKKHPYKVVHGPIGSLAPAYLKAAKKRGAYVIAHSHATKSNRKLDNFIFNIFSYRVRYIADYFLACSKQAGIDRFGNKIINSERFEVVNNAIDSEKYKYTLERHEKLKKKYGLESKLIIGHVGRFSKQKNHKFIIEIFKKYKDMNNNSKLILVGDGKLRTKIEKQIKKMNLENDVILTGNRADSERIYSAFDILLFPSLFEGMSLVMLEAQAEGLPILCSNTIDRDTNITDTIEFMDLNQKPEEWAEKINKIKEIRNLNNNRILRQTDYNIETLSKKLENIYLREARCKDENDYNCNPNL